MLACYKVHYLTHKKDHASFTVLAHSECHAIQLMWRYAKISYPDDYLIRFFYDCRVKGCYVECVTFLSPSYIRGLEQQLAGY